MQELFTKGELGIYSNISLEGIVILKDDVGIGIDFLPMLFS